MYMKDWCNDAAPARRVAMMADSLAAVLIARLLLGLPLQDCSLDALDDACSRSDDIVRFIML